jgi:DNA polymerase-4
MTWPRVIVHADMDAFYASVEQLDDPSLRGKPLLIGHTEGRGVVLTASYEARPFKVGSAMPMAVALRRCPHAVVVPPRFARYTEISRRVMDVFADFSPDVEAISLDEAFLEMTGTEHLFGTPGQLGRRIKQAVKEATGGLTVSVGISGTKYVAKVASDLRKPDGLTVVRPDRAREFLAPLPVRRLWGVGPKTEERLLAAGYTTIGQIAVEDELTLQRRLGNLGPHLRRLGNAEDPRRVVGKRRAKSIGSERTLGEDVIERDVIEEHLRRSAESIGRRLRSKGMLAGGVRVKLKTASFQGLSRQALLGTPTDVGQRLYEEAQPLLDHFPYDEPFRLIGMAAYDIIRPGDPVQLGLFGEGARRRRLESAMDAVRNAFGDQAVTRAENLSTEMWNAPNLDFVPDEDAIEATHWEADEGEIVAWDEGVVEWDEGEIVAWDEGVVERDEGVVAWDEGVVEWDD